MVIVNGVDLKNLGQQRLYRKLGVELEPPLERADEVEVEGNDQVLLEPVLVNILLPPLGIGLEQIEHQSLGVILNNVVALIERVLDRIVIVQLDVDHTLSKEHLLGFKVVLVHVILESGGHLVGEVELDHLEDLVKDRFGDDVPLAMVEVLLLDERGLKLCRKKVVVAHHRRPIRVVDVVESLVAILDYIRLVLDGVVGLRGVEKVQNLEPGLISIHDDQLDTFDVTAFVSVRNAPVKGFPEALLLVGVGKHFVP